MPAWTCPDCQRRFARRGQGHECAPAMDLEEYLATGPPFERPIFEALLAGIDHLGPIHVEPVSVGIFLKRAQTFAQLRPLTRWETLSFSLTRTASHPRITRKVLPHGGRFHHVLRLDAPSDIDDSVIDLVAEAYALAPEQAEGRLRRSRSPRRSPGLGS